MAFIKIMEDAAAPIFVDRQGFRKVFLGVVLSLMPVVSFFSFGYVLLVLQSRLEGRDSSELPEWQRPGEIFYRGVVFFLVILTYSAVPFLFTSAAFAMLKMGFVFLPPALITLAIGAALWMAAIFIMPMAMALFLKRRSLSAVFDLGEIYQRTSLILRRYLQASILNLVLLALVSLPAIVHQVGFLLSSPLMFLMMVYMALIYGTICLEVLPRT